MCAATEVQMEWTPRPIELQPKKDQWSVERGAEVLKVGTQVVPGALPLMCDILWEKHIPVVLRDGVTIYTDVFRPVSGPKVPAIISGGPYGKNGGPFTEFTDRAPWRFGIPRRLVSGLEKFEGLDPAYWTFHGYAIIHPDPRGVGWSEGDMYVSSKQDGLDNYDLIEWLAKRDWCNGRVSMAGNSWLTQTQWFTAAEKPPHLTCIAPSEGWNDFYNDTIRRGGIPSDVHLWDWIGLKSTRGLSKVENWNAMANKYPTWNQYWEDRKAKLENIEIPMLLVASWNSALHTGGTFHGWTGVRSNDKWLRVHNSFEWPDLYKPENTELTRKFFDHHMKDVNNGWEFTPKVQLCVLNHGSDDIINRPEISYPLARQQTKRLYLNGRDQTMSWDKPISTASLCKLVDAAHDDIQFTYVFPDHCELTGQFALKLWVEAIGTDDMDLFVRWDKLAADGTVLHHLNIDVGYMTDEPEFERQKAMSPDLPVPAVFVSGGGFGRLRASHRELMPHATEHDVRYTQSHIQKLKDGEIVEAWIDLRPYGIIFEKGQKLGLHITGHNNQHEMPWLPKVESISQGSIVIHTGGQYDSQLVVPYVPDKARS